MIFSLLSCNNRGDEEILKDVNTKISGINEANGGSSQVNAVVKEGVVTLDGQCQGENCADSLTANIQEVEGVKEVVNKVSQVAEQTDLTLRTSVQQIISKYEGVQADVAAGMVVLRGTIMREQIQPLMNELGALQPKKIDNQLAIK